jgi:microcystin-dependent protein
MFGLTTRGQLDPTTELEFERLFARLTEFLQVSFNEDGTLINTVPDTREVGEIIDFAGPNAPSDKWLPCDGRLLNRVTHKRLFEAISTTYGAGDGSTTFAIPDTRGRFVLSKAATGTGSVLGEVGGELDHTHDVGSHTHTVNLTTSSNGGFSTNTNANGGHEHGFPDETGAITVDNGTDETIQYAGASHKHGAVEDHAHTVTVGDHSHTTSGNTGASDAGETTGSNPAYIVFNQFIYTGVSN